LSYYTLSVSPLRALLVACLLLVSVSTAFAADHVIVVLGDSLTAGLGVAPEEAYPALLEARLRREGFDYRVVNAGVSGDTSAGGLRRVDVLEIVLISRALDADPFELFAEVTRSTEAGLKAQKPKRRPKGA